MDGELEEEGEKSMEQLHFVGKSYGKPEGYDLAKFHLNAPMAWKSEYVYPGHLNFPSYSSHHENNWAIYMEKKNSLSTSSTFSFSFPHHTVFLSTTLKH